MARVPLLARPAVPLENTASKRAVAPEYVLEFTPLSAKMLRTVRPWMTRANRQSDACEGR
jgi:hypothetical protein